MKRWSRKYSCCIQCGTTKIPHHAKGFCQNCYTRKRFSKEYQRTYNKSVGAKKAQHKYRQSTKGKKAFDKINYKYRHSLKGKESARLKRRREKAIIKKVNFWTPQMTVEWKVIVQTTEGYCPVCGVEVEIERMTMDHIIPLSKGGIHHINNVQPMCRSCNSAKGSAGTPKKRSKQEV